VQEKKDFKITLIQNLLIAAIGFVFASICLIATFKLGKIYGADEIKKEAVKNHCGKWVSDADGEPCFKWIEIIEIQVQKGKTCSQDSSF